MAEDINNSLFSNEVLDAVEASSIRSKEKVGPVTVLGRTFANDEERRSFFREELRKKLPELKKIEGFPIGEDEDIIALSDPPYYTACPNPWLNDFIDAWEEEKKQLVVEGKRAEEKVVTEPYASDVSEGKYNHIYFKHPYHTKVPIAAIEQYLNHYTQDGDVVFDGFAGTGMTGVASQLSNNHLKSITLDLSPIASYINYYYNYSAPNSSIKDFKTALKSAHQKFEWLYETNHGQKGNGEISSIIWSDVFICPHCGKEVCFWNSGVDEDGGKVLPEIVCPHCGTTFKKNNEYKCFESYYDDAISQSGKRVKIVPIRLTYSYGGHSYYKKPDEQDIELLERISNYKIDTWFPTYQFPDGEKTPDAIKTGITNVHQLYFKRTLIVLSELYSVISDKRLLGIITSIAFRINKRYALTYMSGKWGAGGGPTNGTYYIPSLLKELNIFDVLDSALKKCENASFESKNTNAISTQSATSLQIRDNSIDYIFTDPPFGGNFMYSELNFVWESWLKVFTQSKEESITSTVHKKSNEDYLTLMTQAFSEYYRILKPGRWMSVEFSNTKASIWNILQQSLQKSGFVIANVSSLDKKKGSFNAQTSVTAVKQDLVISCFKPSDSFDSKFSEDFKEQKGAWDFTEEYLLHLPIHIEKENATTSVIERSPKILYDRLITFFVQKGLPVPIDASDFQSGLRERFEECDGMFFTASQLNEYLEKKKLAPEFVPMGLIVSNEADGIEWLRNQLREKPQTYQDIQPGWMQAINGIRKGDILPELSELLEQNFIQEADGSWRLPNIQDDVDKDRLREKALLKEFKIYVEAASKPHARIKEVRVEAIRAGFKKCYMDKDFATIVLVGDKIPQNLLTEDDILIQFYDIARTRV